MRPEGRQLQGEPLLQEELIKNTDSESIGFGRGSPGICISPQRPHAAPRLRPHRSPGVKERGPCPASDRGVVLGVELIGFVLRLAGTLMRPEAWWGRGGREPPLSIQQGSKEDTYTPQVFTSFISGLLLKAGLCPKLART